MTNDAAERLRVFLAAHGNDDGPDKNGWLADLDAALAAERRATVERIRAGLPVPASPDQRLYHAHVDAILDKAAERAKGVDPSSTVEP